MSEEGTFRGAFFIYTEEADYKSLPIKTGVRANTFPV